MTKCNFEGNNVFMNRKFANAYTKDNILSTFH